MVPETGHQPLRVLVRGEEPQGGCCRSRSGSEALRFDTLRHRPKPGESPSQAVDAEAALKCERGGLRPDRSDRKASERTKAMRAAAASNVKSVGAVTDARPDEGSEADVACECHHDEGALRCT
jgi:hypothetical protein